MTTMYVGKVPFATHKRALAFTKQAGLSPTLIHHEPLGLPTRFQEKVDLLLNSEEYWSMDTSDN